MASSKCWSKSGRHIGTSKVRKIAQPYYRIKEKTVVLCDWHNEQYVKERFCLADLRNDKGEFVAPFSEIRDEDYNDND